jgi:hypothetical protein
MMELLIESESATARRAKVYVDGVDIAKHLTRLEITMDVSEITQVVLYCHADSVTILTAMEGVEVRSD